MLILNNKERMLLQDEKSHEELCVQKYNDYANKACDSQLKCLFTELAGKEQQHLDSINSMLGGTLPSMNSNTSNQSSSSSTMQSQNASTPSENQSSNYDKMLCQDSLSTEKYVSATYNTAIFEFRDPGARQVLNHIQKEEQEHGEKIYNYMSSHGMYSTN